MTSDDKDHTPPGQLDLLAGLEEPSSDDAPIDDGALDDQALDDQARDREQKVHLELCAQDGTKREIRADHIIAATGYKVNLERLTFVSSAIRSKLTTVAGTPILSSTCEASVPGIYFVGIAAANSFGPVMRFAFGADFAARTITRALAKTYSFKPEPVSVTSAVSAGE